MIPVPPSGPVEGAELREKCSVFSLDEARVQRSRESLLPDEQARLVAETFKVLGHPSRLKVIRALAAGELCVCEISEVVGLSVSATSHQLQQLRNLRLVRSRSEGKLVHYSLHERFVARLIDDCAGHVSARGQPA
ncbi:MAG: helix-turn-helix transcriptional regulator [Deltaproteobacteria bacterium]|nr:helix-turn-helix transcriptional regulator [Deltaproteobacteria bacterium]